MHSFYVIAKDKEQLSVIKLLVEEMNNPNKNDTDKRVYMLQAIENQQFGVKGSHLTASLSAQIAGIKTIADLHTFVKQHKQPDRFEVEGRHDPFIYTRLQTT